MPPGSVQTVSIARSLTEREVHSDRWWPSDTKTDCPTDVMFRKHMSASDSCRAASEADQKSMTPSRRSLMGLEDPQGMRVNGTEADTTFRKNETMSREQPLMPMRTVPAEEPLAMARVRRTASS